MTKFPGTFKGKKILSFYSYYRPDGALSAIVGRTADKEFPVFHLGPNRHWVCRKPADNFPYKLPELLKANRDELVWIVEGEKDVDTLTRLGFVATCNMGGSASSKAFAKWLDFFAGRPVAIIPDNDKPGLDHAKRVRDILKPAAQEVRLVHLPGVKAKGDVSDWLVENGGSAEKLLALFRDTISSAGHAKDAEVAGGGVAPINGHDHDAEDAASALAERYDASWKPFPVHLLPVEMSDYILEVGRMLSCDPGYVVLSSIVTMGTAIGNARICALNDEWPEPSVFWGCLIAENSTLKSPAGDKGAWPLQDLHDEFCKDNIENDKVHKKEMDIWKLGGMVPKSDKKDAEPVLPPEKATPRRLKVKDITVEKLAAVMSENPKGICLLTDELAGWFGSFTRYKAAGIAGTDMPFWLEVIRAGRHDVDRAGGNKPSLHIRRAGCSVYGSIQHETLASLANNDFFSSGFVARILFCMPPRCKKIFVRGGIEPSVKMQYRETFRKLYFLDGDQTYTEEAQGKPVGFTAKGLDAWEFGFFKQWADRQFATFGRMGGALSKLEAYCARFALLFALVDYVNGRIPCEEINEKHVERATEVVKWFADEAARVYRMVEAPLVQIERERLVEYIRAQPEGLTPNRLFLANPSRYKSTAGAEKTLNELNDEGLIRVQHGDTSTNGGRAKKVFFAL